MSWNLFPFKSIFTSRNRKQSHGAMSSEKGGCGTCGIWCLAKRSVQGGTSGWGHCHDAAASHLASKMQVTCATPHHASNRELRHSTPCLQFDHLVRTHGKWCLCDQRELSTSLSPYSELGVHILASEIQSLRLWWLGLRFWVIPTDLRFINGNYCLHQVCILISTFLQISGYCKACLFLLDCQEFQHKFHWEAFHAQIFHQNGLYQTKWKPQLVKELCNCYSSVIQHDRMDFVNHQLVPPHGGPPWTFITLNCRPYLYELPKPLLNLPHSQKPCESYHRFRSMSAQVYGKTWCRCTAPLSWSLSTWHTQHAQPDVLVNCWQMEQSKQEAIIHTCAWRSKVTRSHSWPQVPSCLIEKII